VGDKSLKKGAFWSLNNKKMKTILIIDDEPNSVSAIKRILSSQGYRVYTAISPFLGLEKAASLKPDVVICDFHMPGMKGVECLTKIRSLDMDVVRILLTAGVDKSTLIEAVNSAGIDYFLTKPVDHALLQKVVEKGLGYQDLVLLNRQMAKELNASNQKLSEINSGLEIEVRARTGEIVEREFHLRKVVDEISREIEVVIKEHLCGQNIMDLPHDDEELLLACKELQELMKGSKVARESGAFKSLEQDYSIVKEPLEEVRDNFSLMVKLLHYKQSVLEKLNTNLGERVRDNGIH
jgi:CheY-like chemotaxis protein